MFLTHRKMSQSGGCLNPSCSRRYDVEMEAIKLYGESLPAVIARVRRTPEYLEILSDRLDDLKKERDDYASHLLESYRIKLLEKLHKMYNINSTAHAPTRFRSMNWKRSKQNRRRQAVDEHNITKYLEDAVYSLDNHPILHSILSVDERNRFKDMGFELAGEYIHSLINSLEPNEAPQPSTQQPYGDKDYDFNFTSKHIHLVTHPSTITIYVNDLNTTKSVITSPPRYYRQRHTKF